MVSAVPTACTSFPEPINVAVNSCPRRFITYAGRRALVLQRVAAAAANPGVFGVDSAPAQARQVSAVTSVPRTTAIARVPNVRCAPTVPRLPRSGHVMIAVAALTKSTPATWQGLTRPGDSSCRRRSLALREDPDSGGAAGCRTRSDRTGGVQLQPRPTDTVVVP